MSFNNHDRVVFEGRLYSVKVRSWSSSQNRYTLGLSPFDHKSSSVIWVCSDLVKKVV